MEATAKKKPVQGIVTKVEDHLALLDETDAIRVLVNGTEEKFVARDWLDDEDGRAYGSVLVKQILGTDEGLSGTTELFVDPGLVPHFDTLVAWMAIGDEHIASSLTDENASSLHALATYFGLYKLVRAIEDEQRVREKKARKVVFQELKERHAQRAAILTETMLSNFILTVNGGVIDGVLCALCGDPASSLEPTYRGYMALCWDCPR